MGWRSLLWAGLGLASWAAELDPKASVLNTIRSVRELAASEADQHLPVRLVGVLTFVDLARPACFLQDDSGGVYLEFTNSPSLKAGQQVRVVGATSGGGFTPIVSVGSIVALGAGDPGAPKRASYLEFKTGRLDAEWTEIQGRVRTATLDRGRLRVKLALPEGVLTAWIQNPDGLVPAQLVATEVRLRGVCSGIFGRWNEVLDFELNATEASHLEVLSPPPRAPEDISVEPINRLGLDWRKSDLLQARTRGRVTLAWPRRFLFMDDGSGTLEVRAEELIEARPGDEVEVLGFRVFSHHHVALEDCSVRRLSTGAPLQPRLRTLQELYAQHRHGEYVTVEGILLESVSQPRIRVPSASNQYLESQPFLVLKQDRWFLRAELPPATDLASIAYLQPGSQVALTGAWATELGDSNELPTYRLLLGSTDSIRVLRNPSWWSARRVFMVFGGGGLAALAIVGWLMGLTQRRLRQTETLMQQQRGKTIRHQGVLLELARMVQSPDETTTLERLTGIVAETLSVARVSVWRFELGNTKLRRLDGASGIGVRGPGNSMSTASFPNYLASVGESRVIAATDAWLDPRTQELAEPYLRPANIRSLLNAPLRLRGEPTGVLCLEHVGEPRVWTPEEQHFAAAAADQLTILLETRERMRAEKALREAHAELELRVLMRTTELAEAKDRAESADRLKSAFLASMSHELRTPLNSILGFTGMIHQGLVGPLTEEQRKQLGMVITSARHLLSLINDILDISKIEAGQIELHAADFDLRESITRVVQSLQPIAAKKGLALVTHIEPDVGATVSDRRRVEQILINLLNNAIKFTDQGQVRVEASLGDGRVILRVSDTGMGIRPEDLERIFKPFQQLDTGLARQHEGTGLGLSICRRLAVVLGGEITVQSFWKKGSLFTLTLPITFSAQR